MAPTQTTADLDAKLATVTGVLDRLGEDLFDLDNNDPTRARLATAPLAGATAAKWADADERLTLLWVVYGLLRDTLEQATALREQKPKLSGPDLARLTDLVTGASIVVPVDTVALASRTQADAAPLPSPCSVDRLLETLSWALAQVSAVVGNIAAVWDRVAPRLSELDDQLTGIESTARAAGVRVSNEVTISRRALDEFRLLAERDPLSVEDAAIDAVGVQIDRARAGAAAQTQSRAELVEAAAGARSTIELVGRTLDETDREERDSRDKILKAPSHSTELATARAEHARLVADLERGEELLARDPSRGEGELAQLATRGDALGRSVQRLREIIGARLAERDELRGRLRGYRALARAHGRGEDVARDELYQRAADLLYLAPCDLVAAGQAVDAYQRSLAPTTATEDR